MLSNSASPTSDSSAMMLSLAALKNARETPGKAALSIIDGVAAQVQQSTAASGSVGRNLNAKA